MKAVVTIKWLMNSFGEIFVCAVFLSEINKAGRPG